MSGERPGKPQHQPRADSRQPVAGSGKSDIDSPATDYRLPASGAVLIRVPLSVRWRDLDAFNHVNNSKYLSYLEEARLRWMMTLPGQWIDERVAPVVAAAHLDYRRPIEWPNEIAIELFVQRLGRTSVTIGHRIVNADNESLVYCDGHIVMVWVDKRSGQSAPLPDVVRVACAVA